MNSTRCTDSSRAFPSKVTLPRVLVLVLLPLLVSLSLAIYNSVRINHDRAAALSNVHKEICLLLSTIPGDQRELESEIACALSTPVSSPGRVAP